MNENDNDLKFENLAYGAYVLKDESLYSENVKYSTAEFMKLNVRRISLPSGRGNIVYLLTNTFNGAIAMINSSNFVVPPTYQRIFYPWICFGNFMGRRYKFNLTKLRNDRLTLIKATKNLRPYATRVLSKTSENIFFSTSDLYENFKPIVQQYPIKRVYDEFFQEFVRVLKELTPDISKENKDKEYNNRLMIIDADGFAFKNGAPLKENQSNPLFLIYLAYLRSRDLSTLNVDMDMLICSKNMFIKFNPSSMTAMNYNNFRVALFKIMNVNLDNYTALLSDEDKQEVDKVAEDYLTHTIVNDAIGPFTKLISPATKGILGDAIDSSIRTKVRGNIAIAQTVKSEQDAIAQEINKDSPKESLFQKVISPTISPDKEGSIINSNPYSANVSKRRESLFNALC